MTHGLGSLRNARHIDKTFYIGSDERFYEGDYKHYSPTNELKDLISDVISGCGAAWDIHRADVWTHVAPDIARVPMETLPKQGWKIHVSATNLNCKEILGIVSARAVAKDIQFKFANDIETLRLMTSKRWARGGSGKFMTIYPRDVNQFLSFIEEIHVALEGFAGSYILSDKRYKDSRCVYYRYGSIWPTRIMLLTGLKQEVLTSPDGREVPDHRRAYFDLPDWVSDVFPEAEDDTQEEMTLNNGRYAITAALSFSNTGGVYVATDNLSGAEVLIKEARPGVELGITGEDATTRLVREGEILESLAGTGISPRVFDSFWDWENFYLVQEYVSGEDMRLVMLQNTPLLLVNPTKEDSERFFGIYKKVICGLLRAVMTFHERGIVIGDLSPTNILFDEKTGEIRVIDLEGSYKPGLDNVQNIHTPGFRSPNKGRMKENSFSDDVYAVGVIMLYSMFPVAALSFIRDDVYTSIAPKVVADIGWANTPILGIIQDLISNSTSCQEALRRMDFEADVAIPLDRAALTPPSVNLELTCQGLASFIQANYRLEEVYSLFPIDPYGQHSNPQGLGFGATGIVLALHQCGFEVPAPAYARFNSETDALEPHAIPPGFINGAAGIAWGLMARGDLDRGRRFLDAANTSPLTRKHHSLYYGMAGIGLTNLAAFVMTGEQAFVAIALSLAEELATRAETSERGIHWPDDGSVRLGFAYGQSGVALFFLRLSQAVGDPKWELLGRRALEYDLSYAREIEPGVLSFSESLEDSQTLEQYIEQGSGGIAKVAIRYGLWDRADGLLADLERKYSSFSGLIYGISGFIDVLNDAYLYSGNQRYLDMLQRPLSGLFDLYLFETEEGVASPGENLFRISCDLATGTSGILYALHRLNTSEPDLFTLDSMDTPVVARHA